LKIYPLIAAVKTRLLPIVLTIVLVIYSLPGFFMRYEADDYCQVVGVDRAGVIGYSIEQYNSWQGRYAYSFVSLLFYDLFDLAAAAITTVLTIAGMVAAWWYLLSYWLPDRALVLAQALTLSFIAGVPNIWQSIYWMNSNLNYVPPIILALVFAGWLLRRGVLPLASSWRVSANNGD
jgi:hypothetical protein